MGTLKINGAEKEFSEGLPATVTELLAQLGIETATAVAEIDGRIIEKDKFSQTKLSDGQSIELVWFVPGG